jgi:nitrogen fixation/metabolism regulation signal transduction histidine kinase
VVKLLTNPVFLHGAAVLFFGSIAFLMGMIFMRLLRKSIQEEADISSEAPAFEALPLHVYNTVIRQLKQQQDELKAQSKAEQQRTRTSERFTEAVFANASCGVLGVGKNGLVKSSNPAAKQMLGFASPVGMSVKDIFRAATGMNSNTDVNEAGLWDEFDDVLRTGSRRDVQIEYQTPAGEHRSLSIALAPVVSTEGVMTGAACLIDDITELTMLRQAVAGRDESQARSASAGV